MRKFWLWALIVTASAAGLGYVWWQTPGAAQAQPYRTATVDRGPITATVRATGTINPVTTVLVGSQLSGQVVEILADYNSPVKAGQVMARLNADQIKARREAARADLAQSQADLAQRRAQLDKARANLKRSEAQLRDQNAQRDRAVAQLADADRNLTRQSALSTRNIGAPAALESSQTAVAVQRAALASAEAQIASQKAEAEGLLADIALAEAQVAAAEATIQQRQAKLKDIEIDLERSEIRSPVDGIVVQRQIDLGQTVAASLNAPTLFTVAQDLRRIDIHANIDEADVGRLKQGQPVTFTVGAYPNRSFAGSVRMVRIGAQTVQNVVTYTAVIGVENRDLALLPGMTANLSIVTDERPNALRVPNAALRFRPAGGAAPVPAASPMAASAETPRRGGRPLEALRERVIAEIAPTPEQAAAIDRILADARQGFTGRDPGLSDEERRAGFRRMRQEIESRIAAALDPERRERFAAIVAESSPRGASSASAQTGAPGRIFVPDTTGTPQPVAVRLGITDGSYTEVLAGDIGEGASVVTGGGPPQAAPASGSPPGGRRGPRLF